MFDTLPTELQLEILSYIGIPDLASVIRVNRTLNAVTQLVLTPISKKKQNMGLYGPPLLLVAVQKDDIALLTEFLDSDCSADTSYFFSPDRPNGYAIYPSSNNLLVHSVPLLHIAVAFHSMQAFILLLSRGANHIAVIPQLGTHLLHTAVASQNLIAAEHLLHLDPLPDAADPIDLDDRTPLHLAAFFGDVGMVKLLLSQGADADVADYHHASPLLMARCPVVTQLLIKAGATVDTYDRYGMDMWQRWIRNPGKKVREMLAVYGKETTRAKQWRNDLLTVLRAIVEPDQDVKVTVPIGVWPYVEDDGQERWELVKCMVASLSAARMANFLEWLRREKLPDWMAAREKVLEAAKEVGLVWQKQPGDKTSTDGGED